MPEYKQIAIASQEVSDREVKGICAVMGNVDLGSDRIINGAFSKTIKERKDRIPFVWQHDIDSPPVAVIVDLKTLGKSSLPSDLLEQFPDVTSGLEVTRRYLKTMRGDEILAGIQEKAINGMSFGYDIPRGKFQFKKEGDRNVREIQEVVLIECSDTVLPMNPATRARKSVLWDLSWALRTGEDITDLLDAGMRTLTPDDLAGIQKAFDTLLTLLQCAQDPSDEMKALISASHEAYIKSLSSATLAVCQVAAVPRLSADTAAELKSAIDALQKHVDGAEPRPGALTPELQMWLDAMAMQTQIWEVNKRGS